MRGAESSLRSVLEMEAHPADAAGYERGGNARLELARLYRACGRLGDAEAQVRAALGEQPAFVAAHLEWAELCLSQGRWAEVEATADRLCRLGAEVEAAVLRGRCHLARQEFRAAIEVLQGALATQPKSEELCNLFSYVLCVEGRDWLAAERAVRQVLELNPNNPDAGAIWPASGNGWRSKASAGSDSRKNAPRPHSAPSAQAVCRSPPSW